MMPLRPMAALLQRLVDKIDPHEGRYRMLFERSPLPMWVVDTQTLRFLAVNDAGLRLYEYSRSEFLAMTASEISRGEEIPFRDFLRREGGEVLHGVFRHAKKTGEMIDIEGVGHLVAWRGRPARLVQINDITERLRTQQTLERLNRELELSHERLRALSRRLFEVQEEERRRLARDLHDDGQALTALKIQLESLARGGAGELAARSRVEEMSIPCSTCSSVCVSSRSACARRSSTTSASPRAALAHRPPGARRRVAGAFRNRGGAARAAARYRDRLFSRRPGGHHERAAPCARAQRLVAALHREWAARNLRARRRPRLRSRFCARAGGERLEPRPRRHGGAHGACRRLVRAALGARPGHGAPRHLPAARHGEGARARMIRVLLADDHALVRAGIHSLLQGMREVQVVGEASSGEEAIDLADRQRPDVVLMDIAMKGITGLEAAARMRERYPEVRVVILSMHSGEEYVPRRCAPAPSVTSSRTPRRASSSSRCVA